MKKTASSFFIRYPFLITFGIYFSIVLLFFFLSKLHTDKMILKESINYFERVTGYKMNPDEEYVYETMRSIHGDGYSIWVNKISDKDALYFENPTHLFFTKYPIKSDAREHWEQHKWKKGPMDSNEIEYLNFALDEELPIEKEYSKNLRAWFSLIRESMKSSDCLYSYNYLKHDENYIGNIDFYIILPKLRLLITINHNT